MSYENQSTVPGVDCASPTSVNLERPEASEVPGGEGAGAPSLLLIDRAAGYLRARLQRASLILYKLSGNDLVRLPGKMRGNRAYAYAMKERLAGIQRTLDDMIEIDAENKRTNAAFITLTVKRDSEDWDKLAGEWKRASKDRSKFFQWARRTLGASSYVYSVESTAKGGFHVHAVLLFPELRQCFERDGVWRFLRLNAAIRAEWGRNVDVRGVHSDEVAAYVTKELHKMKTAERSLKSWEAKKQLDDWERKSILTFALAGRTGVRLFGTSRDIKVTEAPEEGVEEGLYAEFTQELEGEAGSLGAADAGIDRVRDEGGDAPQDGAGHGDHGPGLDVAEAGQDTGEVLSQGEALAASIPQENNSTVDHEVNADVWRPEVVFTRRQLKDILGYAPPPYAGLVDPSTHEYETILRLLRGRSWEDQPCRIIALANTALASTQAESSSTDAPSSARSSSSETPAAPSSLETSQLEIW